MLKTYIFLSLLVLPLSSYAGRIDKAYEALQKYDYFRAKKYFEKHLPVDLSPASQGLAIIYLRNDNPFHNIDSAFRYVNLAIDHFDEVKERKKEKWAVYGFTMDSLISLRQHVSTAHFKRYKEQNSVEGYSAFIDVHTWASERNRAIEIRDSLAFFGAVMSNESSAFKRFLENYPQSEYAPIAEESFYQTQFSEITGDGSLESYELFVQKNPDSPLRKEAEHAIYQIMTRNGAMEDYITFIQKHPENAYRDSAWYDLFQSYLTPYTKDRISAFDVIFTDHPIENFIARELMLVDSLFLPVNANAGYTYMNVNGERVINKTFDISGEFTEGLAIIGNRGKYGALDKSGNIRIPVIYDGLSRFNSGRTIAEKYEKFGIIDRNGRVVLDVIYEDLGEFSEGLCYAAIGDKYGYYGVDGSLVIPHEFDDAYDFENGKAKVIIGEREAYIKPDGSFLIDTCFESVRPFSDTLFIYEEDGMLGLALSNCTKYTEPVYEQIGSLENGRAFASFDGRVVYLNAQGQLVIENEFENYPNDIVKGSFKDSVAIVYKDEAYGRIGISGKFFNKPKYENIGDGKMFFTAQKEGLWGLYDSKDRVRISPIYDHLEMIDNKYIIANQNDTVGVLSLGDEVLVPFLFEDIEQLQENLFVVKQKGKSGVYQIGEGLIVPIGYDEISVFNDHCLFLRNDGKISYLLLSERKEIKLIE